MSYLSIKTPEPTYKTNRRKCGWGAAITNCSVCGKVMMGHNRGVCSRCMRALGGRRSLIPAERVIVSNHFGLCADRRDRAAAARTLAFAESERRTKAQAQAQTGKAVQS